MREAPAVGATAPDEAGPEACGGDGFAAVCAAVDALMIYAQRRLMLDSRDVDWARNRLLEVLGLASYRSAGADGMDGVRGGADEADAVGPVAPDASNATEPSGIPDAPDTPDLPLAALRRAVMAAGLVADADWPSLADAVMGALTPPPSALQDRFAAEERRNGGMAAMRWFYDVCCANDYVKRSALAGNPRFDSHGLTVTINLAKPEFKDPKKAAAGTATATGYPMCAISHDNEGFAGRNKRTLRTVPVTLDGEPWFWQFSPYGYFREHGICVNMRHVPMRVDRRTFTRLMDFTDRFPGYFLGCNAALPRIGGSVLSQDHYQGGGEMLPMFRAPSYASFTVPGGGDVALEALDWPGTAIRVVSANRDAIVEVCDRIRRAWFEYDDAARGIASHDEAGNRQSALSPSAVRTGRGWEMSLILRNNAVSAERPLGVFHVRPEFWCVKQEAIGLIEAQGLFILPGRLQGQLGAIEDALEAGGPLPEPLTAFRPIWDELVAALVGADGCAHAHSVTGGFACRGFEREAVRAAIRDEFGSVCRRMLGDTAVFSDRAGLAGFLEGLGFARKAS
ncbi:galactose-1-phosphate uridylyltransferase [Bifidobacterium avesanii]|uniref:Galactose-1-phosphate uridylyltransferase n=1 Tax=Bifidobacterium avesanii TaxID=1798157 RepID=A0A7K3TIS0_9BIFI|nr:galactose-1-phosphate uridylyltransferase [Bifidobacterium avesanii]